MNNTSSERLSHRVKRWLQNQLIQDVPDDIAVCEHDCRKPQCSMGEWETCERRLSFLRDIRRYQRDLRRQKKE